MSDTRSESTLVDPTSPAEALPEPPQTLGQAIRRAAIGLGLFAVLTAGLIALTQSLTAERIAEQIRRAEAQALFEIIPESTHDNDLLSDTLARDASTELGHTKPFQIWRARKDGRIHGIILPVTAPDGYSGNIDLLIGVAADGQVLGVRVVTHRETPGLGDKIETRKSDWVLDFEGRTLINPDGTGWNVRKQGGEFDQFTGATITPRAVIRAVYRTLTYVNTHADVLFERIATTTAADEAP